MTPEEIVEDPEKAKEEKGLTDPEVEKMVEKVKEKELKKECGDDSKCKEILVKANPMTPKEIVEDPEKAKKEKGLTDPEVDHIKKLEKIKEFCKKDEKCKKILDKAKPMTPEEIIENPQKAKDDKGLTDPEVKLIKKKDEEKDDKDKEKDDDEDKEKDDDEEDPKGCGCD